MFQPAPCRAARFRGLWFLLFLVVLCGSLPVPALAQPAPLRAAQGYRVFPTRAAPGDQVWLYGRMSLQGGTLLYIGGSSAPVRPASPSGWWAFTVPKDAALGEQPVTFGAPAGRSALTLTVLESAADQRGVVLYVNPAAAASIGRQYRERLQRLTEGCQRACPAELSETLRRLSRVPLPALTSLSVPGSSGRPQGVAVTPLPRQRVRPLADVGLNVRDLDAGRLLPGLSAPTIMAARKGLFCDQLVGVLQTGGLNTGQVLGFLNLLFQGDLSTDPGTAGHPAQATIPFEGAPPGTVIETVLKGRSGSGQGVTIHVLDTADAAGDDFVFHWKPGTPEPLYYDQSIDGRPYHGRVVAEVAQAAAPSARIELHKVCSADGTCSTLDTVKALCAVAQEARQGGRHVVNLSLGGSYPSLGLGLALGEVASLGVPTAASYGNRDDCYGQGLGDQCHHFPADWSGDFVTGAAPGSPTLLLSVAGWDIRDDLQEFATYNRAVVIPWAQTPLPSVQAPGEFWSGGKPYFGTSFAAPVVSGLLAGWMSCHSGVPFLPLVTAPHDNPLASVVNACP